MNIYSSVRNLFVLYRRVISYRQIWFSCRHYGPLLQELVAALLQKNPNERPFAKQLLHVPAMQPYVKKFLQCERDRIEIVASDISEITSRSTHERSQIVSPGKTEKRFLMVNMTEESNASHQGEEIQMKHSHTLKHPQQIPSAKQRLSRKPKSRENNPARVKAPRVRAMLGEDKMTHYPVLLQLVACEAIYFRSS